MTLLSILTFAGRARADLAPHIVLKAHEADVHAVSFSSDGQTLASGGDDQYLIFWDLKTASFDRVLDHPREIWKIYFQPDGKQVGVRGDGDELWFFDPATKTANWISDSGRHERTVDQAFTNDSKKFAVVMPWGSRKDDDGKPIAKSDVDIFDVDNGTQEIAFDVQFRTVSFSPDGTMLALTGDMVNDQPHKPDDSRQRAAFCLADVKSGKITATIKGDVTEFGISYPLVKFIGDGKTVLYRKDDLTFAIADVASQKITGTIQLPAGMTGPAAVSADGRELAVASDKTINVYDVVGGKLLQTLTGLGKNRGKIAVSPDGKLIAAGSDHEVLVWSVPNTLATGPASPMPPAQQSAKLPEMHAPDGGPMADSHNTPFAKPVDPDADKTAKKVELPPEYRPMSAIRHAGAMVTSMLLFPDGKHLLVHQNLEKDRLYSLPECKEEEIPKTLPSGVFSPDGKQVAWIADKAVWMNDVPGSKPRKVTEGYASDVVFDLPTKMLIASFYDGHIEFHDLHTLEKVREVKADAPRTLVVSPDGKTLAVSGGKKLDDTGTSPARLFTTVFDINTGEMIAKVSAGLVNNYEGDAMYERYDVNTPIAFVDAGHKLFCRTSDDQFSTLNLDGPREVKMTAYNSRMRLVTLSPDGKYMAGVALWEEPDADKPVIHLYEIATGKQLADFSGISNHGSMYALHFSADGKMIFANSGKTVLLWTMPEFK